MRRVVAQPHTECFCKHATIQFPRVLGAAMNNILYVCVGYLILVFPAPHETTSFHEAGPSCKTLANLKLN